METPEQMNANWAKEIADAGAQTEEQMRDAEIPTPKTPEELMEYVKTLTDRPHDYGTCVYAMSHAAVAAFNFVAQKLGVTGFQASCADLDILKHTRRLRRGQVLDYENLLYPQYQHAWPSWDALLEKNKKWLKEEATKRLAESPDASGAVSDHWRKLAAMEVA